MIELNKLTGGYTEEPVIKEVSFSVDRGEFFGIIGPNGSGKSTLIKLISQVLPVQSGQVLLNNQALHTFKAKDLAKELAVLSQHNSHYFSFTVEETIELGRYAHQGLLQGKTKEDRLLIEQIMKETDVFKFRNKTLDSLSGGERQRVLLAQALVQQPKVLILDEPTNHLDLAYQKGLLDLIQYYVREEGLTVISIFHDLNIASLYCDQVLLLEKGEKVICDHPSSVIEPEYIQAVYQTQVEKYAHTRVSKPQIMLSPELTQRHEKRLTKEAIQLTQEHILIQTDSPFRVMSSAVINSGVGWYSTFLNRRVPGDYAVLDYKADMKTYLQAHGLDQKDTVAMMTAAYMENVGIKELIETDFSVLVLVTAGINNAVDAAQGSRHTSDMISLPGTINTWIFIDGNLTEEAFLQSIVTATEAKTVALRKKKIIDQLTDTLATGTSTDSVLIAASQTKKTFEFAGPISPLGSHIGSLVYEATLTALTNYLETK